MNDRVLCVDDDPNILSAYQRGLRKQFKIDTAQGGEEALMALGENGPYAVIVADMKMPGMDGIQLLTKVRKISPETVRMMLTGNADQQTAIDAVNEGRIFRFLTKPCPPEMFAKSLEAGINQYHLINAERELLEDTLKGSIRVLTDILAAVDAEAFGRAERLKEPIRKLAATLGIDDFWEIEMGAMLSNIGRVTVPQMVLAKHRKGEYLSMEESKMLERVPKIGHDYLVNIPRLESVARIVLYQNKHFDGRGYPPDSVSGEEIPLGARVIKLISDLVDLEIRGVEAEKAPGVLQSRAGVYDPKILETAATVFCAEDGDTGVARPMEIASLADLQPGSKLLSDIHSHSGQLLVPTGTALSTAVLERLRNWSKLDGIKLPIFVEA